MGAPTSLTKWIPEDDLLLKNAVEVGASLESLAKGAVQFSRRFTIRELRDRWHSLLYDLDTSTEASARIAEIEIELAASNLPKASRACNPNSKVKESSSRKRKVDNVRSHYYAMRKRIRSEPCATNLSFLEPSTLLAATGCDSGPGGQLKPQMKPPADNFGLEIPFSGDFRHPETGYDGGKHALSELMRANSAAGNGNGNVPHQPYHAGHMGSAEDEIPDGTSPEGCLFAYPGNISSKPCDDSECNHGNQSFEHNFQQRDFPHILGENIIDTSSDVHEISQTNALSRSSPYKNENIGDKPLSRFDSSNNNHEGVSSDFVRNINLSSHVMHYGYSSPPSGMPMWRTMEDISTPTMRMDGHYGDKDQGLLNMDDHKNISAPGRDVTSSEPKLDNGMCGSGLHNPTIMPENDFMDFSDTYMDFAGDESLLFIDVNEKDNVDRSCLGLSSILLSSPSDTRHGVANAKDLGAENVLDTCFEIPDVASLACPGEPNVSCYQMDSGLHNDHNTSASRVNMPSTSSQASNTAILQEIFMICVVNSQDLEIPNNDHVMFPPPFSYNQEQSTREITGSVSSDSVLSTDRRDPVGDLNKVKEQVANVQLIVSPSKESSPSLTKVGVLHSCDGCAVEAEPSKGDSIAGGCIYADNAVDEPKPCKSETVGLNSTPVAAMKEESTALCFQNQDNPDTSFASFLENHLQEIDDAKILPLNPEEASMQVGLQTCLPSHPNVVSAEVRFSDTVAITSTSDQEEQFSDSEDDVPYFSDIEALILDMDLGPYDEETCLISKEVSRYQHIDTKNTLRVEQGFHSRTNRSISSQGAFAVFYGRHLKYFIKEPEVLIGRETAEFKVDIDLGKEGRANRVSRRQAIIKMDEEGAFSLNNIGKFSIFVNGKEVPAKKRINLLSHSIVKILDMNFAFEVNERAVRLYAKKLRGSNQELNSFRFDWKPDRNP